MTEHHPVFAPSSLPMLECCPCFERGADAASMSLQPSPRSDYRDKGTVMHRVFERWMKGKSANLERDLLSATDIEGIQWAIDYAKVHVSTDSPVEIEQRLVLIDDHFNVITYGTGDVINGPRLFDLKTGDYHNYWLQIACYGLMQMDRIGVDVVSFDLLFTRFKKVIQLTIHREEATKRIMAVVEAVMDPKKKPRVNPYCKWCKKIMTCEAVVHLVGSTVIDSYEIKEPAALAAALKAARIIKEWSERVEFYAKSQALAGVEIPGFILKTRQGAREIMDVKHAYELSKLPPDVFISLCTIGIGALEDQIATREEISKSAAKKVVNERLAAVIQRRNPTIHLALDKQAEEPTEK